MATSGTNYQHQFRSDLFTSFLIAFGVTLLALSITTDLAERRQAERRQAALEAELEERFTDLQAEIAELDAEISERETELSGTDDPSAADRRELAELQDTRNTLGEELRDIELVFLEEVSGGGLTGPEGDSPYSASLKDEIADLQAEIAELDAEIAERETELSGTDDPSAANRRELAELQDTRNTLREALQDIEDQLTEETSGNASPSDPEPSRFVETIGTGIKEFGPPISGVVTTILGILNYRRNRKKNTDDEWQPKHGYL